MLTKKNLREKTKKIKIKDFYLGGTNDVLIQTMTLNKTSKIDDVVKEINEYATLGCKLVRVSILDKEDALAIKKIKCLTSVAIVCDIHFDYTLAILAIENGADKIRINPGNIKDKNSLIKIINKAKECDIAIRIGINTGSISYKKINDLVKVMKDYIKIFEENNFYNLVLSIKSSDPEILYKSNLLLARKTKYPIHIGLTESGDIVGGLIKSSICLDKILKKGIGNTIRVSLPKDRKKEISACKCLLSLNNLKKFPNIIACPTCGRTCYEMDKVVNIIKEYCTFINKDIKIAIMGCIVNGIGEAGKSDVGIFGKDDKLIIYKDNKFYKQIDNLDGAIEELKNIIDNYEVKE